MDTDRPADFKFSKAANLQIDINSCPLQTADLECVRESFAQNICRVQALGKFPSMIMHSWVIWVSKNPGSLMTNLQNSDLGAKMHESIPNVDELFSNVPNHGTYIGIESILSSMLLGTWTAFETLAGDLWETSLNLVPK